MTDPWNPTLYHRFQRERSQPFEDLVGLIQRREGMRLVDLGCGTGELTVRVADALGATHALGIDNSDAMLERAAPNAQPGRIDFARGDLSTFDDLARYDLVFSTAALQWVPDHPRWLPRLLANLAPGAQIAVQMPRNFDQPSHKVAEEIAREPRFASVFTSPVVTPNSLVGERYAEMLHAHGFRTHVCFEKIYGHELGRSADVVEWVRGTLLNAYLPKLPEPLRGPFVDAYRGRLLATIGEHAPYFFTFRRLLFWGRKD